MLTSRDQIHCWSLRLKKKLNILAPEYQWGKSGLLLRNPAVQPSSKNAGSIRGSSLNRHQLPGKFCATESWDNIEVVYVELFQHAYIQSKFFSFDLNLFLPGSGTYIFLTTCNCGRSKASFLWACTGGSEAVFALPFCETDSDKCIVYEIPADWGFFCFILRGL